MKGSLQYKHLFIYFTKHLKMLMIIGIIDSIFFGKINQNFGLAIFIRFDDAGCYQDKTLVTILHFYAKKTWSYNKAS